MEHYRKQGFPAFKNETCPDLRRERKPQNVGGRTKTGMMKYLNQRAGFCGGEVFYIRPRATKAQLKN